MLNRYLIFDRAESHWMHIGYDSKSSAQRAAKKMRASCGDPSRYVVVDQTKKLPDEQSPAVNKAMERFHKRVAELKAEGKFPTPSAEVTCMDAAEILVDGFVRDTEIFPDGADRNELVRRLGTLLSMQREALKKEHAALRANQEDLRKLVDKQDIEIEALKAEKAELLTRIADLTFQLGTAQAEVR